MTNLCERIRRLFKLLQLSEGRRSSEYLFAAIELMLENRKYLSNDNVIKFYLELSDRLNTSPKSVERAIHFAVLTAWSIGNLDLLEFLFGTTNRLMPTNHEFIVAVAKLLKVVDMVTE